MNEEYTVRDICALIEALAPLRYGENWDNPGLTVGDPDAPVRHIYIGFDSDLPTIREAIAAGADFLLTHHPLIFRAVKNLRTDTLAGKKISLLIRNGVAFYGSHTPFDAAPGGMADLAAQRLGLTGCTRLLPQAEDGVGIGVVGELPQPMAARDFAAYVKERFGVPYVQLFAAEQPDTGSAATTESGKQIRRVAVLPGGGNGDLEEAICAGADAYVAGDISHHTALDAMDQGVTVVNAMHYGTEYYFMDKMEAYLREKLPAQIVITRQKVRFPGEIV